MAVRDTTGAWHRSRPPETASFSTVPTQRSALRATVACGVGTCPVPGTGRVLNEQFAEELRPALRAATNAADDRFSDLDVGSVALRVEDVRERLCLAGGVVGLQVQLRQLQLVALREQLLDPLARRME